jgi:ribose transport system ATP-binding protein
VTAPVLQVRGLTKHYPGTVALDAIDLEIRPHEVVGLIGENGAGKSTLLKILVGLIAPDAGELVLRGEPVSFQSVSDAARAGVGMVFQEQSLIPNITVAENILLGAEGAGVRRGVYHWKDLNALARRQLDKVGSSIDPSQKTDSLSFADRQMVEVAKVLAIEERTSHAPIILLDEPTSVLERDEIETLFVQIERLRRIASVVFVSHRLDEVLRVSDRVYVMRNGTCVAERDPKTCDVSELYKLMVGRELGEGYYHPGDQKPFTEERVRLRVRDLARAGRYAAVSFDVRAGEVLGIAGVQGSGREDLCRTLFGAEGHTGGSIAIDGSVVHLLSPDAAARAGIGYCPAERRVEGVINGMSVAENMTIVRIDAVCRGPILVRKRERQVVGSWVERLHIKTPTVAAAVQTLSGGNQQKVVLAKWLISDRLRVLILDHPTRGLDVGTKSEVYALIRRLAADGMAIVLLADTLEETIALSHNVMVMKDGRIVATFAAPPDAKPSQVDIVEKMV